MKALMLFWFFSIPAVASVFPENLKLPAEFEKKKSSSDLNSFYSLGEKVLTRFEKYAHSHGASFKLIFDNQSRSVNATAYKKEGTWFIKFLGGLLKHKDLDSGVFTAILCHEIGHHIGGEPFKPGKDSISVEGQADYFTTNICLKDIFLNTNLLDSISNSNQIPKIVKEKCQSNFTHSDELDACIRSTLVSVSVGKLLSRMGNTRRGRRSAIPKINKRSKIKVSQTLVSHPEHQCRLDTFFEGSLCHQVNSQPGDNCEYSSINYQGSRPACWYSENQAQQLQNKP